MNLDCSDLHAWPLTIDAIPWSRFPGASGGRVFALTSRYVRATRFAIHLGGMTNADVGYHARKGETEGLRAVALGELLRRARIEAEP